MLGSKSRPAVQLQSSTGQPASLWRPMRPSLKSDWLLCAPHGTRGGGRFCTVALPVSIGEFPCRFSSRLPQACGRSLAAVKVPHPSSDNRSGCSHPHVAGAMCTLRAVSFGDVLAVSTVVVPDDSAGSPSVVVMQLAPQRHVRVIPSRGVWPHTPSLSRALPQVLPPSLSRARALSPQPDSETHSAHGPMCLRPAVPAGLQAFTQLPKTVRDLRDRLVTPTMNHMRTAAGYPEQGCFQALYPEIKSTILGFLDMKSLCRASQVSRELRELSEFDSLWRPFATSIPNAVPPFKGALARHWEETRKRKARAREWMVNPHRLAERQRQVEEQRRQIMAGVIGGDHDLGILGPNAPVPGPFGGGGGGGFGHPRPPFGPGHGGFGGPRFY